MKAPLFSLLPFLFLLSGLHLLLPFVIEIQSVLSHFFFNRPFFPPLTLTTVCHVRRRNRNPASKLFLTFHHRRTTDQHRGRCNNTETPRERPPPIFELTSCACVSHRGAAAAVPFITREGEREANERPVLRGDRTELKKKKKRGKGFFFFSLFLSLFLVHYSVHTGEPGAPLKRRSQPPVFGARGRLPRRVRRRRVLPLSGKRYDDPNNCFS